MRTIVDTTKKTITLLEELNLEEFKAEFDDEEWNDYSIIPFVQTNYVPYYITQYVNYPVYYSSYPNYLPVYFTTGGNCSGGGNYSVHTTTLSYQNGGNKTIQ